MPQIFATSTWTMKSFLRRAATASQKSNLKQVTEVVICIGNEAGDADSIISSMCMAYLRQAQASSTAESTAENKVYLPIIAVERKDLSLRRDVELLLGYADISFTDVLCIDECNFAALRSTCPLSFILLDHNELSSRTADHIGHDGGFNIIEILDHHREVPGAHPECRGQFRNIAFDEELGVPEVLYLMLSCLLSGS